MLEALAICAVASYWSATYTYFLPDEMADALQPAVTERDYADAIIRAADGQAQDALIAISQADQRMRDAGWPEVWAIVQDCDQEHSDLAR